MIADLGQRNLLDQLLSGEGMVRLDPPILMPADPYFNLAGEEFRRRLLLTAGSDGGEYCLRPEFTLPLAQHFLAQGNGAATYTYSGPVFRQRNTGPTQFEQAGIEILGAEDGEAAVNRVFSLALEATVVFGIPEPTIKLGSVALFEALLASLDLPEMWRPRLRHRFGHPQMLAQLLHRLPQPHKAAKGGEEKSREILIADIAQRMAEDGLSPRSGRTAEEIADRFLEKQALAAAAVPLETVAALEGFLAISDGLPEAVSRIRALKNLSADALAPALDQLQAHFEFLTKLAPEAKIVFDAGFAPRLDYYTGLVFEVHGRHGLVLASGGQYDRLLQRLGASREIPASGCSLWVERLQQEATI